MLTYGTHLQTRRRGISLIEVIVVVSICGVLLALLLVAVQRVRGAAQRLSCASNLRQLALAVQMFHDAHHHFPPGCAYPLPGRSGQDSYYPGMSWHSNILAYIEEGSLAVRVQSAYRTDPFGRSRIHDSLIRTVVPLFVCPADSRRMGGYPELDYIWANTSYLGVAGSGLYQDDGIFHPGLITRIADITDGTTNTIMIGERPPGVDGVLSGWYSLEGYTRCPSSQVLSTDDPMGSPTARKCRYPPVPLPLRPGNLTDGCHLGHFWSLHSGGANFAFADGSVRFLSYEVGSLLPALATRAGGEVVLSEL